MSRTPSPQRPRPIGHGSRRLQWLAVVIGFLFFLLLLAEGTVLVLRPQDSALEVPPVIGDEHSALLRVALGAGAAVLLGGLSMLLGAACAGRYRFLTKVAGLLLFLGAGLRLLWPVAVDLLYRENTFGTGLFLGFPLLGADARGDDVPDALIPASIVENLPLWALIASALLTFLGLVGLIVTRPLPLHPDWSNERAVSEVFDEPRRSPAPADGSSAARTADRSETAPRVSVTQEPITSRISPDQEPRTARLDAIDDGPGASAHRQD